MDVKGRERDKEKAAAENTVGRRIFQLKNCPNEWIAIDKSGE